MQHFVLVYDASASTIRSLDRFPDAEDAHRAFLSAERAYPGTDFVVTMLMAPSVEDLKITHGNLFSKMDLTRLRQFAGAVLS